MIAYILFERMRVSQAASLRLSSFFPLQPSYVTLLLPHQAFKWRSLIMRFEYYHAGLEDVPKLSVDGIVSNSVHFSHWKGNRTPSELRADTSTEIALNLVAAPNKQELTKGIELVTNNHFDTDGVLSVWTVLAGEHALELRDKL